MGHKGFKFLVLVIYTLLCFNAHAIYISNRSRRYTNYLNNRAALQEVAKLNAEALKADKAGKKELAKAYREAIVGKKKEAQGYSNGSGGKVKSGQKKYKAAMALVHKIKNSKALSADQIKAVAQEDAKDFLKAAKYERLAINASEAARSYRRRGRKKLSAKLADKSVKYKKLAAAYRTGDIDTIDAVSIELGYKKAAAVKK
jgi:hypothetical protein